MDPEQVRRHLAFARELGVTGISRDPAWRTRAVATRRAPTAVATTPDPSWPVPSEVVDPPEPASGEEAVADLGVPDAAVAALTVFASAAEALAAIRADIGDCTRCKLHSLGRQRIVFGVGNPSADLMFVGEAPGADEDVQGIPFVGKAGQLLTKIIEAIEMSRDDVYIANVIKCRPPQNRNPEWDEVGACEPFLFRQIEVIKPKVIVALGKFAAQALLRTEEPISKLRGRRFDYRGVILVPTFHPAYLLRNPSSKRDVWEDMKMVRGLLRGAGA